MSRYRELASAQSAATVHRVEDAASLRAFVVEGSDFEALYRDVELHARAATRLGGAERGRRAGAAAWRLAGRARV